MSCFQECHQLTETRDIAEKLGKSMFQSTISPQAAVFLKKQCLIYLSCMCAFCFPCIVSQQDNFKVSINMIDRNAQCTHKSAVPNFCLMLSLASFQLPFFEVSILVALDLTNQPLIVFDWPLYAHTLCESLFN